ncbi:MAG: hypothetical protein GWN86_11860, partial [Desulfobacterales bacterium]|nr:hypothetical protein [Desulfobacterales bacterium]
RNKTDYCTKDLRRIFLRGIKEMGASPNRTIEVEYGRTPRHDSTGQSSGMASIVGGWMVLRLPHPGKMDFKDFILTFEHELAHNLGVKHDEMEAGTYLCQGPLPKWAEGMTLGVKKPKPKPTMDDKVQKREEHVRRMVERWERKLKLAKTKLAHWKRKLKYYEGRKAAKGTN